MLSITFQLKGLHFIGWVRGYGYSARGHAYVYVHHSNSLLPWGFMGGDGDWGWGVLPATKRLILSKLKVSYFVRVRVKTESASKWSIIQAKQASPGFSKIKVNRR